MSKRYDSIMCMLVDEPAKAQDEILFYQLRFSSGRTEGAKLDESEIRSYAEALLEKYGEKQVAVSRQGKIVATYFNRKAHDSALDKAIKTADGATGDKLYADVKAIYSLFSNILLTYSNEQSVQKLANEGTKKCLELAAKVKGVRDEAIKACDAVEVETSKWSFSSGKSKPSGFGNWWFKIGTEEKNFSGNWSSAKAEAIKYAKEKGISRISLMT